MHSKHRHHVKKSMDWESKNYVQVCNGKTVQKGLQLQQKKKTLDKCRHDAVQNSFSPKAQLKWDPHAHLTAHVATKSFFRFQHILAGQTCATPWVLFCNGWWNAFAHERFTAQHSISNSSHLWHIYLFIFYLSTAPASQTRWRLSLRVRRCVSMRLCFVFVLACVLFVRVSGLGVSSEVRTVILNATTFILAIKTSRPSLL